MGLTTLLLLPLNMVGTALAASNWFGIQIPPSTAIQEEQMSFVLRLRRNGLLLTKPILTNSNGVLLARGFAQAARKEDDEDEEELKDIDQRRLPTDYDPANFDPTEHRSPPTDRVFGLVDQIAGLTLVEVAELGAIIMKRKGMTEPPVIGVMKPGSAALAASKGAAATATKEEKKKPEKTVFELKLESYEASAKIKIIKEVRTFTDLGLKEAKELVEKAPAVLKGGVSKEEAEQIIEKMKALGAKVVME